MIRPVSKWRPVAQNCRVPGANSKDISRFKITILHSVLGCLADGYKRFVVACCQHFQNQTSILEVLSGYLLLPPKLGVFSTFLNARCHKSEVRNMKISRIENLLIFIHYITGLDSLRTRCSGERIPVGGEIFRTRPDRPWGPLSLLYNGYLVFPRG